MSALTFTAVLTAVLVVGGNKYISVADKDEDISAFNFFSSNKAEVVDVQFIEVKNIVITLNSEGRYERYLQLELALAAHSDDEVKKAESIIPAIRSATVKALSSRDYAEVRAMTIEQIHDQLMIEYRKTLGELKIKVPFDNVVISKLVFQ